MMEFNVVLKNLTNHKWDYPGESKYSFLFPLYTKYWSTVNFDEFNNKYNFQSKLLKKTCSFELQLQADFLLKFEANSSAL